MRILGWVCRDFGIDLNMRCFHSTSKKSENIMGWGMRIVFSRLVLLIKKNWIFKNIYS